MRKEEKITMSKITPSQDIRLAWLAGIIDGEGSISVPSFVLYPAGTSSLSERIIPIIKMENGRGGKDVYRV